MAKVRPLYSGVNMLGYLILMITLLCEWVGWINSNSIPQVFTAHFVDILIPEWTYVVLMVMFVLWLTIFSFDQLSPKYDREENRGLDDLGVKIFTTEVLYAAAVICFCYHAFVVATILVGITIPMMLTTFFVFSYHSNGRTKMEIHAWSVAIGFLTSLLCYLFIAFLSVAIEASGSSVSGSTTWYYAWISGFAFIAMVTYAIMAPSFFVTVFNTIILVGIGSAMYDHDQPAAVFAFIMASIPCMMGLMSLCFTTCCK